MSRRPANPTALPTPEGSANEESPRAAAPPNGARAHVVVLGSRLNKYWRDLGAVLVAALALLTLFGVLGLSSGTVLNAWADVLRRWLGWGAILVPISLGWLAWMRFAVLFPFGQKLTVRWWRVIAAEGAAVALLGLMNLAIGADVLAAAAGRGGGLVGWGIGYTLARVLPPPTDGLFLLMLFLAGLFLTSETTAVRLRRLRDWFREQGFEAISRPTPRAGRRVRARPPRS